MKQPGVVSYQQQLNMVYKVNKYNDNRTVIGMKTTLHI